jgi:hypothetical protein
MMEYSEIKKTKRDVLVAGGGTAGFVAAIAAARNGAKVLLVEAEDYLGGTLSGAMVTRINGLRHQRVTGLAGFPLQESSYADEQFTFGIAQEFVDRLIHAKSAWGTPGKATVCVMLDAEIAKWVIDQMIMEAGVDVLFNTNVVGTYKDGNSVKGAFIQNAAGRTQVEANVIIDATAEGWVALSAGASFELGRPGDHQCQPLSLYYLLANVNMDSTLAYLSKHPEEYSPDYVNQAIQLKKEGKPLTLLPFKDKMRESMRNGDYPIPFGAVDFNPDNQFLVARPIFRNGKTRYDVTTHNQDMAYKVNPTNPEEMSRALMGVRDVAVKMAAFHLKYIPGYEDSYLSHTAQKIGVREGNRIIGDYVLTAEEIFTGKTFEDAIGRSGKAVDIHNADSAKKGIRLTEIGGKGWFHVPYRILLPRGIENLLVVGRCASTDHVANGAVRSEAVCMLTGQAAGTAAALAVKKDMSPRALPVSELQQILVSQGVLI